MADGEAACSALGESTYPENISSTYKSKQALRTYRNRLDEAKTELFVPEDKHRFVVFWDLPVDDDEFKPEQEASSLKHFHAVLDNASSMPRCRFIFLHTVSSRARLRCSLHQLTSILAYHNVMPAFLDFCFTFKTREKPVNTTLFRLENHIGRGQDHQQNSFRLGRAVSRIQHAFSLMAFEPDGKLWRLRHATVYHSFETAEGKSLWIIVKGNRILRQRLTSHGFQDWDTNLGCSVQVSFKTSLTYHLITLEWCSENWDAYIDHLEEQARQLSVAAKIAPIEELCMKIGQRAIQYARGPNRNATGMSQSSGTTLEPEAFRSRVHSGLSRISARLTNRRADIPVAGTAGAVEKLDFPAEDDDELKKTFKFDDLRDIRKLIDEIEVAILVIGQDQKIVASLQERYEKLQESNNPGTISSSASPDDLISEFSQQLAVVSGDLGSHQARLATLLHSLERSEEMFNGILQYVNMRTGEHFAKSTETSASVMEEWTERMHDIAVKTERDTVSMHVITVFTLIFLPGTFVSTLFSSGIWDFDNSDSTRMGDWDTRVPALKLFFAICIPLMAVTLLVWWILFRLAQRQYKLSALLRMPSGA